MSPIYSWNNKLLVTSQKEIVFVDNLDERFKDVRYVFVSRHRAESGIPSLTAHFPGNFGPAAFGGNSREIAKYSPSLLKNYMISLNSRRSEVPSSYNFTLEATHHGPTSLGSTVLFVELGSSENEWNDINVANVIAKALISALDSEKSYDKCAIGIGGTHYPGNLNDLIVNSDITLGPIVPKYALEYFDNDLLEQIISKSDQEVSSVIIDYKGLGKYKEKVMDILNACSLEKLIA
ncbi:MAG: D-aminoacyl-tRNA deacylase [Nitrososphaerales archaeon]